MTLPALLTPTTARVPDFGRSGQPLQGETNVVLASAVRSGLTGWRVSHLTEWLGAPRR